jgi:hypothetical protein
MEEDRESLKEAYIQGGIDTLKAWLQGYELGQEAAKQIYKE